MNWLVKWGVKKYVLGIVNSALKAHSNSIKRAREIVATASTKIRAVLGFFDSFNEKLADNFLTDEEGDAAIEDAKRLAVELTK